MKKLIIAGMLCTAATVACAQTDVVIHTVSHHFQDRGNGKAWNEANTGIGVRHETSENTSVQVGVYRNSIDRTSAYVVGDWTPIGVGPVRVGAFAGAATGYERFKVAPVGGLVARVMGERYGVTFRAAPKVSGYSAAVVTVELNIRFN